MRRIVVGILIVLGWSTLGASPALGCSCAISPSALDAREGATFVFSGRATGWEDPNAGALIQGSGDPVTVTFAVERVWKGDVGRTMKIETARGEETCGFSFQKGESYLVYTYDLHVSLCSRTKPLSAASGDLAELGAGREPLRATEPTARSTDLPQTTPGAAAAGADEARDYETCPAGKAKVVKPFTGYLDLQRLVGTYDRGCDDCSIAWCQVEPRHGPFVSYYPGARTHMQGFYKNGKREGAWMAWYPDGTKYSEGAWHEDRKHGLWKLWYPNGHPQAEMEYTNDVPDGRERQWYENGRPRLEGAYMRGKRSGTWRLWDENGTLRAEGPGGGAGPAAP